MIAMMCFMQDGVGEVQNLNLQFCLTKYINVLLIYYHVIDSILFSVEFILLLFCLFLLLFCFV